MKNLIGNIYDRMLYVYCYVDVYINQKLDEMDDFRKNANWIKKNGRYDGK